MTSPADLNRHTSALLQTMPQYRDRNRLSKELAAVMGTTGNQESFGAVVSSLMASVNGASQTVRPLAGTLQRPWTALPEKADWGGKSWIRITGALLIQHRAQQENQHNTTSGNGLTFSSNTATGVALNSVIAASKAMNSYTQQDEITGPAQKVNYHMWLAEEFPNCFPLLYVIPGSHERIKPGHKNVGPDGRVYMNSLAQWNPSMQLPQILFEAVQVFTESFPMQSTLVEDMAAAAAKTGVKIAKGAFAFAKQAVSAAAASSSSSSQYGNRERNSAIGSLVAAFSAGPWPPSTSSASPAASAPTSEAPPPCDDVKATEPGTECVICMENKKAAFLRPCGHVCTCMSCAKGIKDCPLCRKPITETFKAFI